MTDRLERAIALAIALAIAAIIVIFRSRIPADFWPLDASRVGPNLLASACITAPAFVAGVLAAPFVRRAAHRFIDAKLEPLHARHDEHRELLHHIAHQLGVDPEQLK